MNYTIKQCANETCRFRFPVAEDEVRGHRCPRCGTQTNPVSLPARRQKTTAVPSPANALKIDVLLDNIRSVYNVGSLFRTADGAGVRHMHLCGITAPPNHPQMAKTALGAEGSLAWTQYHNGVDTAVSLQQQGFRLWALEDTPQAESLFTADIEDDGRPVLFIVGNEKVGVDPGILAACETIFSLPMQGIKDSLNVAVAFGIAIYHIRYGLNIKRKQ